MPWFNLNRMKEEDMRAIYQYIRHLGPGGKPAPDYVAPDGEPPPPYALFPPPPPHWHRRTFPMYPFRAPIPV